MATEQQARFDQLLTELGGDLYRVRQRLAVGDWAGLLPHAEALEGRYAGRRSETAYMVFQALMWSRLAVGQARSGVGSVSACAGLSAGGDRGR